MFSVVVTHNQNSDVCVTAMPNVIYLLIYLRGVCLVYNKAKLVG